MEKNTMMVIAMVVLFLFAAVQSVQLTMIKNDLASAGLKVGSGSTGLSTTSTGSTSSSSASSSSTSLDNLPGMVGGC